MTDIIIDRNFLLQTLTDLLRINSINPSLSTSGQGEYEIATYVAKILNDLELDTAIHEIKPGRFNVVGILRGRGGGRSLILNAHTDTVGVEGMTEPFSANIRDGKLYGRGSQDMKGSLAAMIAASKAIIEGGFSLAGDLLITAVADEEYASMGTEDVVKRYKADAAIVTEPTDLRICLAHRGFIWYEVNTFGRAAHGSRFEEGIDANMLMGRFLSKLSDLERELRTRPSHSLAGPPSLHAAKIQGGSELSIYAAQCNLHIERRTTPGEIESQVTRELQDIIDLLAAEDPNFKATLKPYFQREPFEASSDLSIVKILEKAASNRLGKTPKHSGQTFWTDAALFSEAGMDTVLIGPVGEGLHSAEEWVDLNSVEDLAYILADTAVQYCS